MKYPLADPVWSKKRMIIEYVDMVIGGEFYKKIIRDKSVWVDELKLWSTLIGWTVDGITPNTSLPNLSTQFSGLTIQDIDQNLQKFWEIEEIGKPVSSLTSEHSSCAKHLSENLSIASDSEFIVKLPFKFDRVKIANNRSRALASVIKVQRSLSEDLRIAYSKFIEEYLELGHM